MKIDETIGKVVKHEKFGEGVIVEKVNDGRICVAFVVGRKIFQFPQSFENGFLRFSDENLQKEIDREIEFIKEKIKLEYDMLSKKIRQIFADCGLDYAQLSPLWRQHWFADKQGAQMLKAIDMLKNLEKLKPHPEIEFELAALNYDFGNLVEACYWLKKAIKSVPPFGTAIQRWDAYRWLDKLRDLKVEKITKSGFGFDKEQSIDVADCRGEAYYLNALNIENGEVLYYYRYGSVGCNSEQHIIDSFAVIVAMDDNPNKALCYNLYLDMYNPQITAKTPENFYLRDGIFYLINSGTT